MNKFSEKWCKRFMRLAKEVSTWSKDTHKVGAVIVNGKKQIIGLGYNGFAKGVLDTKSRIDDKELKRLYTIHAEENAILNTYENNTENTSIFIYGYPPCVHCTSLIIQAGIKDIYFYSPSTDISEYWKTNLDLAKQIALEVKLNYINLKDIFNWDSI
jgi:dCMP deaminase